MTNNTPPSYAKTALITTCRLIAGGAILLAGIIKLRDPALFMHSIHSFELLPESIIPFLAYFVPWTEIIAGVLLAYGVWTRASGTVTAGMYAVFTLALLWVLWNDLPVDCGCFGGLFGSETVGWGSILRNMLLTAAALVAVITGGGATSLDHIARQREDYRAANDQESTIVAGQTS